MQNSGSIILLNGASSAGKSTLAKAVQAEADLPLLRFSLDQFFFGDVLPDLRRGGPFEWSSVRPRLLTGYYGCLAAFARAGSDLVVDHIFETSAAYEEMMTALRGLDLFIVGVHCPIEELERREIARGDRHVGDARKDLETVHTFCDYDFEVDSTATPEANAALIWQVWRHRGAPSAPFRP